MLSFTQHKFRNTALFLSVCCTLFTTSVSAQGTGTWGNVTTNAPHTNAGEMLVQNDGTVLCKTSSGGSDGTVWDRLTPVNGSYKNGTWTSIHAMNYPRLYFSSQVLPDGRMYVCGGEYGTGGTYGEVYDPATNTWTITGLGGTIGHPFPNTVSDANSEMLPNGTILQACVDETGVNLNYIWSPTTNVYTTAASCLRIDNEAVWIKLPDSSIIFMDNYNETSERYMPKTGTWINDATSAENLYDPYGSEAGAGFLLPNGKVWFIGSLPNSLYYTPSGSTAPGTWTNGPTQPDAQGAPDAPAAMMANGRVLLTLSPTPTAANNFPSPTQYYEFDYTTNTFILVGAPGGGTSTDNGTYIGNMVDLPDGTVLFANQGDNTYYIYTPGAGSSGGPLAVGQPTISTVTRENCDTFQITGTLFNGITEGAAYGDDWQMNTNFPIVRITTATNTYYATTYNWNRIGAVATGTLPDTCIFKLPAGLAEGTYSVTVVANGNPSAPFQISTSVAITPTPVSPVCSGATTTLSDSSTVGAWSSANTSVATIGTSGVITGVAAGTTTISFVINHNAGCFATTTVTINAAPTAISGNPVVCQGAITTLSDVTTGGTWSSTTTSIASVDGSGNVTGSTAGTTTISYTSTTTGCATSVVATVNSLPTATITPLSSTTFCSGSSVTLDANTGAGFTYQWVLGGVIIPGANSSSFVATLGGDYTVIVTNANNCSATSTATTVTTTAGPGATITPAGPTTICAGSSVALDANTGAGLTYQWQSGGTNISGATSSVYSANTGGDYTVIVSLGVCTVTSSPTTVTVNTTAVVSPISGSPSVCTGLNTTLNDDTTGGVWSSSNSSVATVGASTGTVTGMAAGSATITYTFTNACGSASTTEVMTVNASSTVEPITGTPVACIGNTTSLADGTSPGTWSSSTTSIATVSGSGLVTGVTAGTAEITYSYTNAVGCVNTSETTVTISSPFTASITALSATTFCPGGYVTLDATTGTGYTYQWQVGGVNITGATSSSYTSTAAGNYTCIINSPSGCTVETGGTLVTVTTGTIVVPTLAIATATGDTICNTTAASTFTAVPTNGGTTPTYKWLVNGTNAGTGATYSYVPANGDVITCILTSNAPCAFPDTSATSITMSVVPAVSPSVSVTSVHNDSTCIGDTVQFAAVPVYGGTAPTYLWTENGINVATGPYYIYAPSNNDTLVVTMTSNYPCLATNMAVSEMFIIHALAPTANTLLVHVSQSSIVAGSVDTFTAVATGAGSSPSFQWYINGNPVAGATGAQYITDSLRDGQIVNCEETSSFICSDPASVFSGGIIISVSSSIQQVGTNNAHFTLVPNPNNGTFTVQGSISSPSGDKVNIVVTDVLGQTIYNKTTFANNGNVNEQIALSNAIPAGTYQVSVTSGTDHVVFHVVIEK